MHFGELIDRVVDTALNLGGDDAAEPAVRRRLVVVGQELAEEVWSRYPWSFTLRTATTTYVTASGYALLPANFYEFGPRCEVYLAGNPYPLEYLQPQDFTRITRIANTGMGRVFTEAGVDAATQRRVLKVYPAPGDGAVITVADFRARVPLMLDNPTRAGMVVIPVDNTATDSYRWCTTFAHPDGGESNRSPISDPALANIPGDSVQLIFGGTAYAFNPDRLAVKLYRSLNSGPFLFLDDLDPDAASYFDTIPDPLPAVALPTNPFTGLEAFPESWALNLFLKGLRAAALDGTSDGTAVVKSADFQRRLTDMWKNHSPEAARGMALPTHWAYRSNGLRG